MLKSDLQFTSNAFVEKTSQVQNYKCDSYTHAGARSAVGHRCWALCGSVNYQRYVPLLDAGLTFNTVALTTRLAELTQAPTHSDTQTAEKNYYSPTQSEWLFVKLKQLQRQSYSSICQQLKAGNGRCTEEEKWVEAVIKMSSSKNCAKML